MIGQSFRKYSIRALLVYLAVMLYANLLGTYTVGHDGIALKDYGMMLAGTLLLYIGYQCQKGKALFVKEDFIHALVAIITMVVTPYLYEITFEGIRFKTISIYFAYTTGVYFFLTILQKIMVVKIRSKRFIAAVISALDFLVLVNPFLNLVYFLKFNSLASVSSFMSLYYTTLEESVGYIRQQISPSVLGIMALGMVVVYALMYIYNYRNIKGENIGRIKLSTIGMGLLSTVLMVTMFNYTYIPRGVRDIHKYAQELQQYAQTHEKLSSEIQFANRNQAMIEKVPGTIIFVIGESANRDYMSVYHPDFKYDSTPWERKMRESNPNFLFFTKAYSCYVQTIVSLEQALTESSQYERKDFVEALNIIDIAKKLGYNTYWLSNQGIVSRADTSNTLIAKQCTEARWVEYEHHNMMNYDEELLDLLKEVPKEGNNLIVLHIMGSHGLYENRYPKTEEKFFDENHQMGVLETYSNSLHYSDKLLEDIYNYSKENLNLQAMVYMSDHSENLYRGHNADAFDFSQTRIPFWMYLSPQYQEAYPETVALLKSRENNYWTNDMFYDLFVGLLHAQNNKYRENQDFSSEKFNLKKEDLKTLLGKYNIMDDPEKDR